MAPDSFADLDAKLKSLEEKTKAELAKLQSDTAAPSSFLELPAEKAMSFSDLDAKFAAMEDSQKREMARLHVEPAPDSSFLERSGLAKLEAAAKPKEEKE